LLDTTQHTLQDLLKPKVSIKKTNVKEGLTAAAVKSRTEASLTHALSCERAGEYDEANKVFLDLAVWLRSAQEQNSRLPEISNALVDTFCAGGCFIWRQASRPQAQQPKSATQLRSVAMQWLRNALAVNKAHVPRYFFLKILVSATAEGLFTEGLTSFAAIAVGV
jgi:hypothetical protein